MKFEKPLIVIKPYQRITTEQAQQISDVVQPVAKKIGAEAIVLTGDLDLEVREQDDSAAIVDELKNISAKLDHLSKLLLQI